MYVRDLTGKEYVCQLTYTVDEELNGNITFDADVVPTKANNVFIDDLAEMWELVDDEEVEYKIIHVMKQGVGNRQQAKIKAIPLFFDDFSRLRIYEEYNQSLTAQNALNIIFNGSGYNFVLNGTYEAKEWEGFGGGETRLDMFKKWLNRYGGEFGDIVGNTVYIDNLVGRDTSIMYRHRLNASNIVKEIDATNLYTYARGYGNYEDSDGWEDAKLNREYTSPLAQVLGIRHAPPIKDGRIKNNSTMDKQLKALVDESLKISVSADIHDLRKQGYPIAQAKKGDRVFLIDERIGLKEEVRVVNVKPTKDWRGEILDIQITFGSQSIVKRYQSNLNNSLQSIKDILDGKVKLPFNVLDNAVIQATKALKDAQSQLIFSDNGILAVDKTNPNNVVLFNSAGIGVSNDGGNTFRTAMTGNGIVADLITAGTLRAINIDGVNIKGSSIEGTTITSRVDNDNYIVMTGAQLTSYGEHDMTWMGGTGKDKVRIGFSRGQLRARNDTKNWSLYFNDYGISTFADGDGQGYPGGNASGAIEFHSTRYSGGAFRGLTIMSYGRTAIESSNENGARIYLNPNGASVRVSDYEDNYFGIAASNFSQSSRSILKRNIKTLEDDALALINSLNIKEYKRLTKGVSTIEDTWQAGILVEEAPQELLFDGDSVDLYTYINYIAKAIQQLSNEVDLLKE